MLMVGSSKLKVRTRVNLVTSYDGLQLHHKWICNKCFMVYPSYEAVRLHKKDRHAY